jgi:hypothetical protein
MGFVRARTNNLGTVGVDLVLAWKRLSAPRLTQDRRYSPGHPRAKPGLSVSNRVPFDPPFGAEPRAAKGLCS